MRLYIRHGFTFLSSLLSFASCLQRCGPPQQVVDHHLGLRSKLGGTFVHVTALVMRIQRAMRLPLPEAAGSAFVVIIRLPSNYIDFPAFLFISIYLK